VSTLGTLPLVPLAVRAPRLRLGVGCAMAQSRLSGTEAGLNGWLHHLRTDG
jgi:hypothetical protein